MSVTNLMLPRSKDLKRLCSNPLDELDTLNHYGFSGRRDFVRRFQVLTVNYRSSGDETIFLAAQLAGTDSIVVHHDPEPLFLDYVRQRARVCGVDRQIRWADGSLESLFESVASNPAHRIDEGFGPFDYVRCTSGLNDRLRFDDSFELLLRFLKEDGVLGMSCFGYYGREPYRQMQILGRLLNGDRPGAEEELDRLKELFAFLPDHNWTRLAFDELTPEIRTSTDEAFAAEFLIPDRHALKVSEIYELLDRHGLHHAGYSRQTRMYYEPYFAQKDPELAKSLFALPSRDREAVSEIAWGTLTRHHFRTSRNPNSRIATDHLDNIPFFNPFQLQKRNWKKILSRAEPDATPMLALKLTPEISATRELPWGHIAREFVRRIDGYKTMGEIIMQIREESEQVVGIEEIAETCFRLTEAFLIDDIVLLRDRGTSLLPYTARRLPTD